MPLLSSTLNAQFPPKSPNSHTVGRHPFRLSPEPNSISRRNAAVLLSSFFTPLLQPPLSSAVSFGISGPKEWLKEQKKNSAKFLLAPVDASRNILRSAYLLLMKSDGEFSEKDFEEVQKLLVSASRDCVPLDRNSFVEFQAKTGVEVCTFRLIVKNASSLLDDKDPLKLEAESKLTDLIRKERDEIFAKLVHKIRWMMVLLPKNCRSFTSLNDMARGDVQLTLNRVKVADALKVTISCLNNFEQGIRDCLEV